MGFEKNIYAVLRRIADGRNGSGALRVCKFSYNPSDFPGTRAVGTYALDMEIPAGALVCGGFVRVNTAFATGSGTIAISIQSANDIITAAAVSGAPWSTTGIKAIVPKVNTPESTGILLTAVRRPTITIASAAVTTGQLTGYLFWYDTNIYV